MTKENRYSLIILAFCGVFTDFLTAENDGMWFPRDRIIHLIISFFIWIILIYILSEVDFNAVFIKFILLGLIILRLAALVISFLKYFQIFYGDSSAGILFFTAVVVLLTYTLKKESTGQLLFFYTLLNIVMILLLFGLCLEKINTINLYATDLSVEFSLSKLTIYTDIIILMSVIRKEEKCHAGRQLLVLSTIFLTVTTFMQGMCIGGELLYSLSPLQSLVQIFMGETIKRYDFILNILFTINYFGAVIFNVTSFKTIIEQGENV